MMWNGDEINESDCRVIKIFQVHREAYPWTDVRPLSSPFNIVSRFGNYTYPNVAVNTKGRVIADVISEGFYLEAGADSYLAQVF